jgi:ABC-type multidrug transport system fused ATPase/permease subunit
MPSTIGATKAALTELIARLRPSRLRLVGTIFVLLGAGAFEGATVGLLVPLLAVLVTPTAGAHLPVVGDLLNGIPVGSRVTVLGLGILGLVGLKNLMMVAGSRSAGALRFHSVTELQRQLLERVMRSGVATLERHTSGEITDIFVSEAYRVNRFIDACLVFVQRSASPASGSVGRSTTAGVSSRARAAS